MFGALLDLVLPAACVGCGAEGTLLCRGCERTVGTARRHSPDPAPPGLPETWTAGRYSGALRALLLGYKERDRRDLAPVIGCLLARATRAAVMSVGDPDRAPLVLVPIPSRRAVARQRGGDHVRRLLVAAIRADPPLAACPLIPALRVVGRPVDAVGLDTAHRWQARAGVFAPRAGCLRLVQGRDVVLVDDLITTGATLVDAARALAEAGARPAAAVTLAATARRRPARPLGDRA